MAARKAADVLVLASNSPRRRELLKEMGIGFETIPPEVSEDCDPALSPETVAEILAQRKAKEVAARFPRRRVLGADTIVVLGKKILGKPADREEAETMLQSLSDSAHRVITGLCLVSESGETRIAHETTEVRMRKISPQEIEDYLRSGEWEGKAGAYAIQETADRFVVALQGSFDNVVGLPTELLRKLLAGSADAG